MLRFIVVTAVVLALCACGPTPGSGSNPPRSAVNSEEVDNRYTTNTEGDATGLLPTRIARLEGRDGWSLTLSHEAAAQLGELIDALTWNATSGPDELFPDYYASPADPAGLSLRLYLPANAKDPGKVFRGSAPDVEIGRGDEAVRATIAFVLRLRKDSPLGDDLRNEHAVLKRGDVFVIRNKSGELRIEAESNLKRTYTWDGASRSVFMMSRGTPWQGALGLYWPGPGDHWENHAGVTRGVIVEEQRDFKDDAEFRAWLKNMQQWYDARFTPDGIVGGWSINKSRNQLNVEVWRITIGSRQPETLEGGTTDWLTWTHGDD